MKNMFRFDFALDYMPYSIILPIQTKLERYSTKQPFFEQQIHQIKFQSNSNLLSIAVYTRNPSIFFVSQSHLFFHENQTHYHI